MMQTIHIDLEKTLGAVAPMHAVNNGPAGSDVRGTSNTRYFREAEIPYIRNHDASFNEGYGGENTVDLHRIFRDFDADENDPANYDFRATDGYMKRVYDAGCRMFYRLGASIEHGVKRGTYPPKDNAKWARVAEHIIRHYTEGWADGFRYDVQYWEIWNEPDCKNPDGSNPCWQGTDEQFFDFYEVVARHLKAAFPHLSIGGPAICSPWGYFCRDFLFEMGKRQVPMDFFSFHAYSKSPHDLGETIGKAAELLREAGLANVPMILNEWNYIKGWIGEEYLYSIRSVKGLKGAAFTAGCMCVGQAKDLAMLMYYDARPSCYNGLFNTDVLTPLKGYYPFRMYSELYKRGEKLAAGEAEDGVYFAAAKGEAGAAVLLSRYLDEDEAESADVAVAFTRASASPALVRVRLLDDAHDDECVREEVFTAQSFTLRLSLPLFTTALVTLENA